jgi:hypothetical protein
VKFSCAQLGEITDLIVSATDRKAIAIIDRRTAKRAVARVLPLQPFYTSPT